MSISNRNSRKLAHPIFYADTLKSFQKIYSIAWENKTQNILRSSPVMGTNQDILDLVDGTILISCEKIAMSAFYCPFTYLLRNSFDVLFHCEHVNSAPLFNTGSDLEIRLPIVNP